MLPLFPELEAISSCRDRSALNQILLRAFAHLLGEDADVALFRRDQGETGLTQCVGPTVMSAAFGAWDGLLRASLVPNLLKSEVQDGRAYGVIPLHSSEVSSAKTLIAFAADEKLLRRHEDNLLCVARVYGNHVKLLDYSELDSLTRLLNRKTFEETFERLLQAGNTEELDEDMVERRSNEDGVAWLCVIDIDHFKRINDNFGHLFGDEVLLRMGDLMRKSFRSGDRLFRFGGEEFVVILNADNESLAQRGFDRFRQAVESNEFPQVGKETCSIGFTRVSDSDIPTDVVGRADEALYYAKENGRNQVRCYEALLAEGMVSGPAVVEAPVADFDIDALFD
ncbi:MAG: Diguanylate cyclase DosC [Betaproteobacteria bacterium ADurb.Bin341]|nr:MAG: Diguanylate cyclase DosC [Betaproteobacteria bacterium ADurb.Bin341]